MHHRHSFSHGYGNRPTQDFFLKRLSRLVDLDRATPKTDLAAHSLIGMALVSTYKDLLAIGCMYDANTILRRAAS